MSSAFGLDMASCTAAVIGHGGIVVGSYQLEWVLVSYLVAVFASYTALKTLGRIHASKGAERRAWLLGGALAMGVGIWSMHFVGMLAFRLPIQLGYDLRITAASLFLSIAASAHALWLLSHERVTSLHLIGGAVVMGLGIAAVHYVGMAAMLMNPDIEYHPVWFSASILIAILAAGVALLMAHRLRDDARGRHHLPRIVAGMVMGLAIFGMHYTGMAAARFQDGAICGAANVGGLTPDMLGMLVVLFNVAVLGTAISISTLDRSLRERTAKLSASLFQANHRLEHLASHDALTGLPNRRLLIERLQRDIDASRQQHTSFAVLFVDLDGFKGINDAFGHLAGDAVLVRAATTISRLLEPGSTVARLGGDEFVVAVNVPGIEAAEQLAQRILSALRAVPTAGDGCEVARITASIGVAVFPDDGPDASILLAHADAAMYSIKQSGCNGVGFFSPAMRESSQAQAQLAQELRGALERGEFVLHFQPLVDAATGTRVGKEALVRWQHPRLGLVMPDQFIGLAERMGLIVELGEWVLDEACRSWAQWRKEGLALTALSVNLSPLQLRGDALFQQVQTIMRRHDMPNGVLTLEITESAAILELEASDAVLARLAEAGARISIDDFGTGFSSLAYLAELPTHELKIDRRFIARLTEGGRHAAIVRSVIALAQQLGLDVVAEGVESAEQADILREMGCTRLQGWHIGRPVPAAEVVSTCGRF